MGATLVGWPAVAAGDPGGSLEGLAHTRVVGSSVGDLVGFAVSAVGDVNGDGIGDLALASPLSASVQVVFGALPPGAPNPADLDGFDIESTSPDAGLGRSVAGAGDVNGDGLDDIVVGARYSDHGGEDSGSTYVVLGKTTESTVILDTASDGVARIDGIGAFSQSGATVSGAGDVDGDSLDDILVGAPYADEGGLEDAGCAYVVFGAKDFASRGITKVGAQASRSLCGDHAYSQLGSSLAPVGDFNGDGKDDWVTGAPLADVDGRVQAGTASVVFGGARSSLSEPLTPGVRIMGAAGGSLGTAVAGIGDFNGDGRADVAASAPYLSRGGDDESPEHGGVFVIHGKSDGDVVDLNRGDADVTIRGASANDRVGTALAGLGDVDQDGDTEIAIGAPYAMGEGPLGAGVTYVVRGSDAAGREVGLGTLGDDGRAVPGSRAEEQSGFAIAGGSDLTGDGESDVVVGAPSGTSVAAGVVYVVPARVMLREASQSPSPSPSASSSPPGVPSTPAPPVTQAPPASTSPIPAPSVRRPQTAQVIVPKRIRYKGRTVLLGSAVRTNAGQTARTSVRWAAGKKAFGRNKAYAVSEASTTGRVVIRTKGKVRVLRVRLTVRAPAKGAFSPFRYSKTWTVRR